MKVLTNNEAQAKALYKAFRDREQFTLTGAGMTAFFVAETLNNEPCPFGSTARELNLELTQISYPVSQLSTNSPKLSRLRAEIVRAEQKQRINLEQRDELLAKLDAYNNREHLIRNACTAVNQRVESYNTNIDCSAAMRAVIEAMIDAGYRKP